MGLDGGTIATRTDVLRRSSWRLATSDGGAHRSTRGGQLGAVEATAASGVEGRSRQRDAADAFSTCALSGEALPLRPAPGEVVACGLGWIYSRDSVVLYLSRAERFAPGVTDVAALEATFGHLQTLRDVFSLTLVPNPRRVDPVEGASPDQEAVGAWLCPIDGGVSTNGHHPFGALRPCGHVLRLNVAHEMARRGRGAPGRGVAPDAGAPLLGGAGGGPSGSGGGGGVAGLAGIHGTDIHSGPTDGISSIYRGQWDCPVCSAPVEVLVRLFPPAGDVAKCRTALLAANADMARRKRKKKGG